MKRITKDLYEKLLDAGLIDTTKNNANCYTSCRQKGSRRKKKYVCEQVLIDYEKLLEKKQK